MLRARGQTQRALELYEQAPGRGGAVWLHTIIGPEMLIDPGRRDEARAATRTAAARPGAGRCVRGVERVRRGEARAATGEGPGAARAVLDRIEAVPRAGTADILEAAEVFDTVYGLALLLEGGRAALAHLDRRWRAWWPATGSSSSQPRRSTSRKPVASRQRGRGRPAADVALGAAQRQGSNHILMQALSATGRAVAPHRRRAERGLPMASTRARADRPGRRPPPTRGPRSVLPTSVALHRGRRAR